MDIFKEITEKRAAGHSLVLATMVRTQGSSPREVGARMLVFPDGSISGTLGGGNFEKMVIDDCLELFKVSGFASGDRTVARPDRNESDRAGKDKATARAGSGKGTAHAGGGQVPAQTGSDETAARGRQKGFRTLLKTYKFSRSGPDATGMCCGGEADVFMELLAPPERLVIFGGGHIARDLVKIVAGLDFRVTIVDDREEILSEYDKPVETVLTDPSYEGLFPSFDENTYVVIVTRSHTIDRRILARVIHENLGYLGMIGSRNKVSETVAFLKACGIEDSVIARVHTPIGLEIGAEGPYEIALSIAAELIATRRKSAGDI